MIAALADWRRFVPAGARRRLRPLRQRVVDWRRSRPPNLGDLRRLTPIDPNWGFERGTPIDRVYVERFVGSHAADIRGRVLEIAAPDYTNAFGRGVEQVDILMATEGNPQATIVGDLTDAPHIPDDSFDCAIVTADVPVRLRRPLCHRDSASNPRAGRRAARDRARPHEDLAPGGRAVRRVVALHRPLGPPPRRGGFGAGNVEVSTYGNVLAASGFLYGLAASDLESEELDAHDPLYEVVIGSEPSSA